MQKEKTPYQLLVLSAHTLLSLLLTYPLVFKFTTGLIGIAEDNLQSVWNLWWVKHAVMDLHTHPYYTDYLFYPLGSSLVFHTLSPFNSILGIPLQFFFNRITSYNLLILLSFVLAGYGMYLLAYQLTSHFGASFIASLVFSYSPYHFAQAGHHLQLSSIQFIPFYVLFLVKLFRQGRLKYSLIAGVFLVLASLCSWYYLVFLLFFTIIFIAYRLIDFLPRHLLVKVFAMLFIWGVMISPFVYPLIKEKVFGPSYINKNFQQYFSADVAAFFIPAPTHPLAPYSLKQLYGVLGGNPWEATVFLGFTTLFLAGYAIYRLKWKETGVWVVSGLIFAVLSIGPRLHILGYNLLPSTPMPYWLVYQIPIFRMISTPSRFVVMVMLSLAVLVGYAVKQILEKDRGLLYKAGMVLVAGLVLVEYLAVPVDLCVPEQITKASFLEQHLAADKGEFAVLELPVGNYWINNIYMYRQTKHERKMLRGNISRYSPESLRFIIESPLKKLAEGLELEDDFFVKLTPLLMDNKIKYIIFNKYLYGRAQTEKLYDLLDTTYQKSARLEDEITIFKVY